MLIMFRERNVTLCEIESYLLEELLEQEQSQVED
jgi:hypothetical protein